MLPNSLASPRAAFRLWLRFAALRMVELDVDQRSGVKEAMTAGGGDDQDRKRDSEREGG